MSHPLISSHALELTTATAYKGNPPLIRTPYFCRSHVHHWKELLSDLQYLGMCPEEHMSHNADTCRQPTTYSPKSGRYGLTLKSFFLWYRTLIVAHRSLTIISASNSLRNV